MPRWRDVRGDRQVHARFVDGPLAGAERELAAAPNGDPPSLLTVAAELVDDVQDFASYELVSWGDDRVARYRVLFRAVWGKAR